MKRTTIYLAACIILFLIPSSKINAQTDGEVIATILHLDSAFWNAYNNCDTGAFKNFVADDVEFYHDKGGITLGAKALIESLNKNICGNTNQRIRREAVAGTVKVYPMHDGNKIYGAIISGEHLFYLTANGKPEYLDGQANFNQLWLMQNGNWKMKQILSYNHHAPGYINKRKEIELPVAKLDQLCGTYKSSQSGSMNVTREDNTLVLKGGNNSYTLYPQSDVMFFMKERDLTFEFEKNASGKPVKMIVNEHGAKADELMFEK